MLNINKAINTKSYYILRSYYNFIKNYTNKKPFLFVHQMGKVGSSTIMNSLKKINYDKTANIYWTHFLSNDGVKLLENLEIRGFGKWESFPSNIKSMISNSYVLSNVLQKKLLSFKKCKIITLIRDPIAVNVSGFFQNNAWWPSELKNKCENLEDKYLNDLFIYFLLNYPHSLPLDWFNNELKNVFGIDVFSKFFSKFDSYKIYENNCIKLLLIKLEKLDTISQDVFQDFLKIPYFKLGKSNIASNKWYTNIYSSFINSTKFPSFYLSKIYDSPIVKHFYSSQEINFFKNKWS